jgi:transposase
MSLRRTEEYVEKLKIKAYNRQRKREKAIRMLKAGKHVPDIAYALKVSRPSVRSWWVKYQAEGEAGLREKKRGVTPKVKEVQEVVT